MVCMEVLVRQRRQQVLNIADRENIFKIIDKNQEQHVLFGIFLLLGRGKQTVLGVVVNHGLRQNLVIFIPLGAL